MADFSKSAMVALYLHPADGAALGIPSDPPEGAVHTDPGDMHVTLAYLGDPANLEDKKEAIQGTVKKLSETHAPVEGEVGGHGRFTNTDGKHAVYASFDAASLPAFRQDVVNALATHGVKPDSEHGFTPHITLGYYPPDKSPDLALPNLKLKLDALHLRWGNETHIYPLGGKAEMADTDFGLTVEERGKIAPEDFAGPDNSFPIDTQAHLDAAAKLIGKAANPDAVKKKAIAIAKRKGFKLPDAWASKMDGNDESDMDDDSDMAKYTAVFAITSETVEGDEVVRRGKIFEAGDYPDKGFEISPAEMAKAVQEFKPVPVDYEHTPGPLDGKMGTLSKIWIDPKNPKTLMGEVRLPKWLHALFKGQPLKVSTTWEKKIKEIVGLALVNKPRVDDAAILAAFAADFAGKRHNSEDQKAIQSMHDACMSLGAACGKAGMAGNRKSKADMSAVQSIHDTTARLGAQCQEKETPMSDTNVVDQPDLAVVTAKMAEMQKQIDEQAAENRKLRDLNRREQAIKFADAEIAAHRAYPAEKDMIVALFTQAARDDETDAKPTALATFGSTKQQVSRVTALRALYAVRPTHAYLLTETVKDLSVDGDGTILFNKETSDPNKEAQPTKERVAQLMGYTTLKD